MRITQLLRCSASAAVVAAVAFGAAGVQAQEVDDGPVTTVDEIIVTAQKREQSLQDVPIVVTSLSGELLEGAGVADIKDMQILTPGLTVTSTTNEASTTARIRGVGTVGDNPGLESSVGVVIDGVYRSRNGVGFGDLGELARIEVLKGPQGTLFGKNTSAGVINIITEAPSFTPGFNAELTAGNYGALGGSASVTGPLSDQIAGRLYFGMRQRDGFYDVDTGDGPRTLTEDQDQDFWTARGQLLILPSDATSIRLIADYTKRDENCCVGVTTRAGPVQAIVDLLAAGNGARPPAAGFGELPFSRLAYSNRGTEQRVEDMGLSAEINHDINSWNATFTSVTSFRDWSIVNGQDIDFTGADILYRPDDGDFGFNVDNLTQEFRLAGTSDRFDWLVGAFATLENISRQDSYFFGADYNPFLSLVLTSQINRVNPAITPNPGRVGCFSAPGQTPAGLGGCLFGLVPPAGPGFIVGQGVRDRYSQRSESVAVFTNNTIRFTDQLDLTVGLRYTLDDKRLLGVQDNLNGNGATCGGVLANQATIAGVLGAGAPGVIGALCLPWANPFYDNREISESYDDDELSGTAKLSFRPNDDLMFYASYAKGYKGAGYNMDRVQTGVIPDASLFFPSEKVDSYEAGFKATLFSGSVLLNATYFNQTFEDFQLNTFLGTAFVVESIPEVTSEGVDADLIWFTPLEGLSFQGGLTYADTLYGDFTAADLSSPGRFPQLSLLPGNRVSFAPEWSASGAVSFDRSLGMGLRGGFNLAAKYMSDFNTGSDLLPFKQQEGYTLVNGRVSIGSEDERWTLDLWAQNLTDEEYKQVGYNAPLQGSAFANTTTPQADGTFYNPATDTQSYNAFQGAPRTYGVTLRVKY